MRYIGVIGGTVGSFINVIAIVAFWYSTFVWFNIIALIFCLGCTMYSWKMSQDPIWKNDYYRNGNMN